MMQIIKEETQNSKSKESTASWERIVKRVEDKLQENLNMKSKLNSKPRKLSWAEEQEEYWSKMGLTIESIPLTIENVRDYETITMEPSSFENCDNIVYEMIHSACNIVSAKKLMKNVIHLNRVNPKRNCRLSMKL